MSGRLKYSQSDVKAIVSFVFDHGGDGPGTQGKAFWEEAEKQKITSHSWQSMQNHYRRHLLPIWTSVKRKHGLAKRTEVPAYDEDEIQCTGLSQDTPRRVVAAAANGSVNSRSGVSVELPDMLPLPLMEDSLFHKKFSHSLPDRRRARSAGERRAESNAMRRDAAATARCTHERQDIADPRLARSLPASPSTNQEGGQQSDARQCDVQRPASQESTMYFDAVEDTEEGVAPVFVEKNGEHPTANAESCPRDVAHDEDIRPHGSVLAQQANYDNIDWDEMKSQAKKHGVLLIAWTNEMQDRLGFLPWQSLDVLAFARQVDRAETILRSCLDLGFQPGVDRLQGAKLEAAYDHMMTRSFF